MKLSTLTFSIAIFALSIGLSSCSFFTNKKFKEAITNADAYFAKKKYNDAKTYYTTALELKPEDKYPAQRIGEIDAIFKAQKLNAQYKKELADADKLFKEEKYRKAKSKYVKTLKIKPNEKYPQEMLDKLDKIIAEIEKQEEFMKNPYHIVVGCFTVENNATRFNKELLEQGYKSRVISMSGGRYDAVTINSFPENRNAYNNLANAKEKFGGEAWIFKH